MKKLILAALAASVVASPVLAAPNQGWNDHDRGGHGYNQSRDDHDRSRGDNGFGQRDHGSRFDNRGNDHRFGQWNNGSRFQYRNWQRGQRFDSRYAYNYRVISNPGYYRLHDAPRGYRWVRSGNDAVLIGLTSGIVAAVMANMIR
jgi:Ni/Co efflux regulator RcnB